MESEVKSKAEELHRRATDELRSENMKELLRILVLSLLPNGVAMARLPLGMIVCLECPKKAAEIARVGDELTIKARHVQQLTQLEGTLREQVKEIQSEVEKLKADNIELGPGSSKDQEELKKLRQEHVELRNWYNDKV